MKTKKEYEKIESYQKFKKMEKEEVKQWIQKHGNCIYRPGFEPHIPKWLRK